MPNIFTDEQWEAIRGDYPADLFEKCRQELLPQIIDAVLDRQSDDLIDGLARNDDGEFPIDFGPFSQSGWAPLTIGGRFLAHVHASQLWPDTDLQIARLA